MSWLVGLGWFGAGVSAGAGGFCLFMRRYGLLKHHKKMLGGEDVTPQAAYFRRLRDELSLHNIILDPAQFDVDHARYVVSSGDAVKVYRWDGGHDEPLLTDEKLSVSPSSMPPETLPRGNSQAEWAANTNLGNQFRLSAGWPQSLYKPDPFRVTEYHDLGAFKITFISEEAFADFRKEYGVSSWTG